jgi:hypothetical protein
MRRFAMALLWLGLLGYPMTSAEAQSLYGPGGLFLHPTANVPDKGQLTGSLLVLQQRIPETPGFDTNPTWGSVALDYGLAEDLELAVTSLMITDFKASYGGALKYRFMREERSRPGMAIGYVYTTSGGSNTRTGFLALRKQLTKEERNPIIGHLGLMYIDLLAGIPYGDEILPYGGVEWRWAPQWSFVAEARARGEGDFKTSTGLTVVYNYGGGNQVALTWANTGQSTQPRFGFGVGFRIGTRR